MRIDRAARGDDSILVQSLQRQAEDAVATVLGGAPDVALIDFPYHRNAGDAAIWAGQRAILRRLGVSVRYVADAGRYDARHLTHRLPDGPILLSGGGNLGDLWPWSQELRARVLRDFPGRLIVQLPQSHHFQHEQAAQDFARTVRRHGNYVMMARDAQSYDDMERLGPAARVLAPDMAFGLGMLQPLALPVRELLVLARDDVEASSGLVDVARMAGKPAEDWRLGRLGNLQWQARRLPPRGARWAVRIPKAAGPLTPLVERSFEAMCNQVLRAGVRLLSSSSVVVTDRLHAHILCVLLGKPHLVLDNNYGKISALHRLWTSGSATTHWATDATTAIADAQALSASR